MHDESNSVNRDLFRDTFQPIAVQFLLPSQRNSKKRVKGRKNEIKPVVVDDTSMVIELSDFIEYLAEEIFESLPDDLKTLSYTITQNEPSVLEKYSLPLSSSQLEQLVEDLPQSVTESLITYGMLKDANETDKFLESILSSYITAATAVPSEYAPAGAQNKPEGCEICDRTQLPLTYHHLIPREVHDKAIKRNWHAEWEMNKVAWLCRACHSFVHKIASNEELAKSLYSVDLLLEREDVQRWATWVSRIRWKAK